MKKAKDFNGGDIREVWNFRLSTANPLLMRRETWQVEIWANSNPDCKPLESGDPRMPPEIQAILDAGGELEPGAIPFNPDTVAQPLEVYDTGIAVEPGDEHDAAKIAVCYEWLYSRRDDYSRDHIEIRKPVVALIEKANDDASAINAEMTDAEAAGDVALADQKRGELQRFLDDANATIKSAAEIMHKTIADAELGANA